jgi:ketosteroid isomerase-like protein
MTLDPETVVRTYFRRLFADRDLSVCAELLAGDYVDHDAPPGTPPGPEATRSYVAGMLRAYPDLRFAIMRLVALDRTVAVQATWRGTHHEGGPPLRQDGLLLIRVDATGHIAERRSAYGDPGTV